MALPTVAEWRNIASEFQKRSNFPNCIGALDGKHIRIFCPDNSGSLYYNYKQYNNSLVLLALVDANYCFPIIDVGSYGKNSDSNIFNQSIFREKLFSGNLNIPPRNSLPNYKNIPFPYVIVADEAFAMSEHVLRPYSRVLLTSNKQRLFNYRLSRTRRYDECTFGIFANKWRVFLTPIDLQPEFVEIIIIAACALHNFVRLGDGVRFEDTLNCELSDIPRQGTGGITINSKNLRDFLADYFVSPAGSVPWQYNMI